MRGRGLPVHRPTGWRYWTRRAAYGVLVGFTRGLLVLAIILGLMVVMPWLSFR